MNTVTLGSLPKNRVPRKKIEGEDPMKDFSGVYFRGNLSVGYACEEVTDAADEEHICIHGNSRNSKRKTCVYKEFPVEGIASCSPIPESFTSSLHDQEPSTSGTAPAAQMHPTPPITTQPTRRESLDSNAEASTSSSTRRLIAIVRSTPTPVPTPSPTPTPSQVAPTHSRRLLCKNFTALALSHAMLVAAFGPLISLQASLSAWWWPSGISDSLITPASVQAKSNVGTLLLASMFILGSLSSLVTPLLIQKIGTTVCLILSYIVTCLFFGAHFFPSVYSMIPAYLMMGIWLGPLVISRITFMACLSNKWSQVLTEEEREQVQYIGRVTKQEITMQWACRGLQLTQDAGIIIGNFISSLTLWYTISRVTNLDDRDVIIDAMFKPSSNHDRLCGHLACPLSSDEIFYDFTLMDPNSTNSSDSYIKGIMPCKTTTMLACIFVGFSIMSVLVSAIFLEFRKSKNSIEYGEIQNRRKICRRISEAFKNPTLIFATPLSLFIGLEQGVLYADFNKSYIVCSLGIVNIPLVFLSLGILQSVAGFTISLLLQYVRRFFVIGMGFAFHSCLLLTLLLWKANNDDAAILFVMAAVWGACNAIWDNLCMSIIFSGHPDRWQAALVHSYFFRYLGLAISFGLQGVMCTWLKLCCLAVTLVICVISITLLEFRFSAQDEARQRMSNSCPSRRHRST